MVKKASGVDLKIKAYCRVSERVGGNVHNLMGRWDKIYVKTRTAEAGEFRLRKQEKGEQEQEQEGAGYLKDASGLPIYVPPCCMCYLLTYSAPSALLYPTS
jgi:hypothetical protein